MAGTATYKQPLGRVMPTVFVAGPAKSGSTFLWDCVQQTFHPEQVCRGPVASWADGPCGSRAFVLPAVGSEDSQPACLRFGKEGRFWTHWGRSAPGSRQYTWRRYGGPALPMEAWEQGRSCFAQRRKARVHDAGTRGPDSLAMYRWLEDRCMQGVRCPAVEVDGQVPYGAPLPPACQPTCDPCELHPGYMNNFDERCRLKPRPCDSQVCPPPQPRVPKRLRRLNFSGYHARAFKVSSAFAATTELVRANVSAARVLSLEGYPGVFQTPPRHARALASLVTVEGQRRLKFVVGLREPLALGFSLWSFQSSFGATGGRVEDHFAAALAAMRGCNTSLADDPTQLLRLTPAERVSLLTDYRLCLDHRARAKKHYMLYGGLYALHLLSWLQMGFRADQFLLVRMTSLPSTASQARQLQLELASFLGLPPPPLPSAAEGGAAPLCLSPSLITKKQQRLRAHGGATVKEVKREYMASGAAAELRTFFAGHDAALKLLLAREGVRVY